MLAAIRAGTGSNRGGKPPRRAERVATIAPTGLPHPLAWYGAIAGEESRLPKDTAPRAHAHTVGEDGFGSSTS
jgi:hypothetical protein